MDERDLREASESLASIRRSIDEMRKIESAKPEPERIVIEPRSESNRSLSIWRGSKCRSKSFEMILHGSRRTRS